MSNIIVLTEHRDGAFEEVSFELLSEARRMARTKDGNVMAVVLGNGISNMVDELAGYGADRIFVADDARLAHYDPQIWQATLSALCQQEAPSLILLPATTTGEDLAARLAVTKNWPLYSRSTKIKFHQDQIQVVRPVYAGKLQETITSISGLTCLVTMIPGVIGVKPAESNTNATLVPIDVVLPIEKRIEVTGFVPADPHNLKLTEVDVIVAAGRGLGQAENVSLVKELAGLLGGAVGATRVVVDLGWLDRKTQIGQTGTTVKPRLYVACGISGATQHTIGMKDSSVIVAINTDPAAAIFNLADLSLNCDAVQLLPVLIDQCRMRGKTTDDRS